MVRDGGRNGHLCGNLSFFEAIATVQSVEGKDSAAYIPLDASTEHASKI